MEKRKRRNKRKKLSRVLAMALILIMLSATIRIPVVHAEEATLDTNQSGQQLPAASESAGGNTANTNTPEAGDTTENTGTAGSVGTTGTPGTTENESTAGTAGTTETEGTTANEGTTVNEGTANPENGAEKAAPASETAEAPEEAENSEQMMSLSAVSVLTIPDENFRKEIVSQVLGNRADQNLSLAAGSPPKYGTYDIYSSDLDQIKAARVLNIQGKGIANLQGIEYFEGLQTLLCSGNRLTALSLQKNKNLKNVQCSDNNLTSIDVYGLKSLTDLNVSGNQISSLEFLSNDALEVLF